MVSCFSVLRVFPSTLLPGFIGPELSVLSVNLPPSVPYRYGVSVDGSVLWRLRQPMAPEQ